MDNYTPIHTYTLEAMACCVTTQPYYHLLYVEKGVGTHTLNDVGQRYRAGDFVVLLPTDHSQLDARSDSRITQLSLSPAMATRYAATFSLLSQKRAFRLDEDISSMIWVNLVESMRLYRLENDDSTHPLYAALSEAMMQLLASQAPQSIAKASYVMPPLDTLLHYVAYYVEHPPMLQTAQVAQHFRCSPTAFGDWFRRNKEMGYKEYVDSLRVKRLKRWLNNPHITTKEIAKQMGFTDEFHLSRFFKKQTSITPTHYRRQRNEKNK